jgi:hypothetical protein
MVKSTFGKVKEEGTRNADEALNKGTAAINAVSNIDFSKNLTDELADNNDSMLPKCDSAVAKPEALNELDAINNSQVEGEESKKDVEISG